MIVMDIQGRERRSVPARRCICPACVRSVLIIQRVAIMSTCTTVLSGDITESWRKRRVALCRQALEIFFGETLFDATRIFNPEEHDHYLGMHRIHFLVYWIMIISIVGSESGR